MGLISRVSSRTYRNSLLFLFILSYPVSTFILKHAIHASQEHSLCCQPTWTSHSASSFSASPRANRARANETVEPPRRVWHVHRNSNGRIQCFCSRSMLTL